MHSEDQEVQNKYEKKPTKQKIYEADAMTDSEVLWKEQDRWQTFDGKQDNIRSEKNITGEVSEIRELLGGYMTISWQ